MPISSSYRISLGIYPLTRLGTFRNFYPHFLSSAKSGNSMIAIRVFFLHGGKLHGERERERERGVRWMTIL